MFLGHEGHGRQKPEGWAAEASRRSHCALPRQGDRFFNLWG